MSFEKSLERLEQIAAALDRADLTLDESLALFEEVAAAHRVRIASLPCLRWREDGNRVVFKGPKEAAEAALAHFERLLASRSGDPRNEPRPPNEGRG